MGKFFYQILQIFKISLPLCLKHDQTDTAKHKQYKKCHEYFKVKFDQKTSNEIVDEATKTGGILGRGLGAILNAAAAGAESFEKSLSEEIEENEESSDEEDSE